MNNQATAQAVFDEEAYFELYFPAYKVLSIPAAMLISWVTSQCRFREATSIIVNREQLQLHLGLSKRNVDDGFRELSQHGLLWIQRRSKGLELHPSQTWQEQIIHMIEKESQQ